MQDTKLSKEAREWHENSLGTKTAVDIMNLDPAVAKAWTERANKEAAERLGPNWREICERDLREAKQQSQTTEL